MGYVLRATRRDDAEWSLVAEAPDGTVAGWAALRSWTEDDGVHLYLTQGEVRPPDRRRGFDLRTATVDDAGAWRRLAERAWAGRPFVVVPSEERLRSWLERSDRSSFLVATAGERVAGFVAVSGDEVEDVAVDPDFQRRGLASALLARALERLGGPARLRTEGHDPAGALSLYERFGFRVVSRHHRYRKPLD